VGLVANPDFWMEGKPHLGSFTVRVISESSARYLAISTGEVHSDRYELDTGFIETADNDPNLAPLEDTWCVGMWDYYINFNQRTNPALKDPVVKKAIAHAIDKNRLVEIARLSYGTVTDTYITPAFFGPAYENPDATTYEYNVFLANQMLDAAGYLDIDADGIREMPVAAPDEEEEAPIEAETIEELQEELTAMSASLSDATSQITSLEADIEALSSRVNSSLNMAYGLGIVALLVAVIAVYYAMRR
jgi:ABC-type transport system substrate-binding protein